MAIITWEPGDLFVFGPGLSTEHAVIGLVLPDGSSLHFFPNDPKNSVVKGAIPKESIPYRGDLTLIIDFAIKTVRLLLNF